MRTITFGVLIVFVGFVAALPFRKSPAPGEATSENALATGPTTELTVTDESVAFDPLLVTRDFGPANGHAMPNPQRSPAGIPSTLASRTNTDRNAIPSSARSRPRRDLRLPLTYDDLAVPLATPHYVQERFDAVAKDRPLRNPQPQASANGSRYQAARFETESRSSSIAASPYQQFDPAPASILEPESRPVANPKAQLPGRLASDSRRDNRSEQAARPMVELPSSAAFSKKVENRVRHWIRQPD